MSMVTQCPSCATTFRVTSQQLQAQHGMVRCGRCATVFDGFKTLASLRDPVPITAAPVPVDTAMTPEAAVQPSLEMGSAALHDAPAPAPAAPPAVAPVEEPPAAVEIPAPRRETPASQVSPALVAEPFAAEPAPPERNGLWVLGIVVLLLALGLQAIYFFRSEIAAYAPEARPYLNRMCAYLRCTVALPQRPRAISIEASDMQATDPANPGVIALTATLRNHATTALGYPALDVVLTNTREHTVARRVFLPSEYLDGGKDARAGIPPNAEITVKLNIDSGDLGAAGFRLDLLAAPAR